MASAVLIPRRPISIEEAEQQFDLLFDEYFKDEVAQSQGLCLVAQSSSGTVRFDSGSPDFISDEEVDEVYIPDERQEPQQVAQREAIARIALELRRTGDQYAERYGNNLTVADTTLTTLFREVAALEYETFQNTVESLTTSDRNTADFVFMMCLSGNVIGRLGNAASKAKNYFRRYIGGNYIGEMAQAGGVAQYVHQ